MKYGLPRCRPLGRRRPAFLLPILMMAGFAGGAPAPASAQIEHGPERLALVDAIALARDYNPDFRTQRSQLRQADIAISNARGDLLPSLSVSNSYGYDAPGVRRAGSVVLGTQPDYYRSSYSLNFQYSLSGQSLLRPGQARTQARAAEARVDGARIALDTQVTDWYLRVLQADAQVEQARTALERARLTVQQAAAQVQVGAATPLDLRRAEVQEGQAEVVLVSSENQAAAARAGLAAVIGVILPDDVTLVTEFELFDPQLDVESLLPLALDRNPVVRASRLGYEASESGIGLAKSQFFPTISLSAGVTGSVFQAGDLDPLINQAMSGQRGRFESCLEDNRLRQVLGDPARDCAPLDPGVPSVEQEIRDQVRLDNSGFPFGYRRQPLGISLNISLPIFTGLSRRNQVESAEVAASNAREQVRSQELLLRSELATAVRSLEAARRTVDLQARIRATAGEELRLAQERFALGLASSIEVADAQANLSQAERDEINALYEFHRAVTALESLTGGPIR